MNNRLTVLIGIGAIAVGGALIATQVLTHEQVPEAPVATHAAPPAPGAEAGKLDYLRQAEVIRDPLERCKQYPAPPGFDWDRAMTDALCTDLLTPRLSGRRVDKWVEDGEAEKLDRYYDDLVDGYWKGVVPEGVFWLSYVRKFELTGSGLRSLLDQWVSQRPQSGHAQLALAGHRLANAWGFRGNKYYGQMPPEDKRRMQEEVDAAVAAAKRAISLNERLLPAYVIAARLDPLGADEDEATRLAKEGLALKPDSYYLRNALMFRAEPMWGGSFAELDAIAEDGMRHVDVNPRMRLLRALALADRGFAEHYKERHAQAAPLFEEGLNIGPDLDNLFWGAYSQEQAGNPARAVEYLSQVIRFSPEHDRALTSRARLLSKLGQKNWALAELERQIGSDYNSNLPALSQYIALLKEMGRKSEAEAKLKQLLLANPQDRWINRQLAEIYLYSLRRFPEAKVHIDAMLARDGDDGAALLLQLDYLQNINAPSLRAAAERFVAHADRTDEVQDKAYPNVVAWLADPGNQ